MNRVGVVGLGLLGRGIAACLLAHDFRLVCYTRSSASIESVTVYIDTVLAELVRRASLPTAMLTQWRSKTQFVTTFDPFSQCEFVLESVSEDLETKQSVFDQLEEVVGTSVPIASNTSALPISQLQQDRQVPSRFLGMHWAEPAYCTRFLELIPGEQTASSALRKAKSLAIRLGKEPSMVRKDIPGFIVNRLAYAMYREALFLVESGVADYETIDRSFRNAVGLWSSLMGPFRWIDLTGGPVLYAKAMRSVLPTLSGARELPVALAELQQTDSAGILNGHGFYEYTDQEAKEWEERYRDHVWSQAQLLSTTFTTQKP